MSDKSLRELEGDAGPGEWSYRRDGDALYLNRGTFGIAATLWNEQCEADFALIVAMRNALGVALHGEAFHD